jgi:hypothetical protein
MPSFDHQTDANRGDRKDSASAFSRPARKSQRAEHEVADQSDQQNAVQNREQTDIEPHVAIRDMAELVRDNALQFFTIEAATGRRRTR